MRRVRDQRGPDMLVVVAALSAALELVLRVLGVLARGALLRVTSDEVLFVLRALELRLKAVA